MSEERLLPDDGGDDDLAALDDILDLDAEPEEEAPREEVETEPEPEPQPRQPQTREERRVNALRKRWQDTEAENKRLRADFDRMIAQTRQPAPPPPPDPYRQAEMQRQEQERLALMAPHEAAVYAANQAEQRMQQQLMSAQVRVADTLDRQNFALIQRSEPDARRLAQQVEEGLILARQNGMNPTREYIYNALVGYEDRAVKQKRDAQARARGRRQVAAETTRPGSPASTAAPPQRRGGKPVEQMSEAELLERIGDQRI